MLCQKQSCLCTFCVTQDYQDIPYIVAFVWHCLCRFHFSCINSMRHGLSSFDFKLASVVIATTFCIHNNKSPGEFAIFHFFSFQHFFSRLFVPFFLTSFHSMQWSIVRLPVLCSDFNFVLRISIFLFKNGMEIVIENHLDFWKTSLIFNECMNCLRLIFCKQSTNQLWKWFKNLSPNSNI